MGHSLQQLRRGATQLAVRQVIRATAPLPLSAQRTAMRSFVAIGGKIPALRRKVRHNMRLALGADASAETVRLYFQHVGWFWSNALATFNRGFTMTPISAEVRFDASISVLDEAVAERRGVILTSAHWSGHELAGAVINQRHPMSMVVRQAPTSDREARKLKWYRALGVDIVLRPKGASSIKDAVAYLNVLKRGQTVAITPDLLADHEHGVETCIFGRRARLYAGAFALSIMAGAPLIRLSFRWQPDSTLVLMFDRAPAPSVNDRATAIRMAVEDWCRWFEERLRANPENWLFWLDRRWSHFLRTVPQAGGVG
jgi:lauroyl/myristoyl acyltransferase